MNRLFLRAVRRRRHCLILSAILVSMAVIGMGGPAGGTEAGPLTIAIGQAVLIELPDGAGTVFVAEPETADVQAPFPERVLVFGKKTGSTTLFALDDDGLVLFERTIEVVHDIAGMERVLASRFPEFVYALESSRGSLLIEGTIGSPERKQAILESIQPFLEKADTLIERIGLTLPSTVRLRVRVLEVNRDLTSALGINWQSLFDTAASIAVNGDFAPDIDIGSVVRLLQSDGKVETLAEPVLTATSKEAATFLAGGAFPYPTAGEDGAGVAFKPFGVSLEFTPDISSRDSITLKVRAEVSGLSSTSVNIGGASVPQTDVRQLDTSINLRDGQTFALGGFSLLSNRRSVSQVPGLGDLPVIGRLFQSRDFQNNRTELIFVITPEIVDSPSAGAADPRLSPVHPTALEYALFQKFGIIPAGQRPLVSGNLRLRGVPGFQF